MISCFAIATGVGGPRSGVHTAAADDAPRDTADGNGADGEPAEDDGGEGGISFPTDRSRERQLDRARRLVADERWSDAATLFDEILAADSDSFFRPHPRQRIWQSIKSEANRLVGGLGKPGREAYELQFRARAERLLEQAVARNDLTGIVAVARRWFHTPAGYRATIMAALESLEANQPLAAAAWLDRLAGVEAAGAFEPSLSVMRAIAWWRAGNPREAAAILERARAAGNAPVRLGGRDLTLSFPPGGGLEWLAGLVGEPRGKPANQRGDWTMHRGDPARNGVIAASAPLLAARYRVPLARHPEEARVLESRRRQRADQDQPLLPAGLPLAVNGTVLAHTPLGLLAVDFETGKRIWLQTGSGAIPTPAFGRPAGPGEPQDADEGGVFGSVFEDATSGTLASDGSRVFVVESRPEAGAFSGQRAGVIGRISGREAGGGNTLAAYEIADRGAVRWRLPARGGPADAPGDDRPPAAGEAAKDWYLGPPLPVGEQLLVLVEEKGEIRLDVLAAATGRLEWTQPLAEVDEDRAIDSPDGGMRRLAGISPALAEGVLVCPTGAGAVVAVDLATRTLLWAYEYPQTRQAGVVVLPNGVRMQRGNVGGNFGGEDGGREQRTGRWLDATPILSGGRVLLTPPDSQDLLCLDLRTGEKAWQSPRKERLYVAGVVDGRAVVVGRRGVEALDMANGRSAWQRSFAGDYGSPSGRGIVTADRIFLPLDTPEVVEIALADGRIVGRTPARGQAIPGNLIAYRGEVISQSADSLDVFHQTAALESRIETALTSDGDDPWALAWRGQLDLVRGDIAAGIAGVRAAHERDPTRVTAGTVAGALLFALRRDFRQAAPLWREAVSLAGSTEEAVVALRTTIDGFLAADDVAQAWDAMRQLLACSPTDRNGFDGGPGGGMDLDPAASGLVGDGVDPRLSVAASRWIQGRFADLARRAAPPLRQQLDAFVAEQAEAAATAPPAERLAALRRFVDRFAGHPAGIEGMRRLAVALGEALEAGIPGKETRNLAVERDFVLLDLSRAGSPADREQAAAMLSAIRTGATAPDPEATGREAAAWPIGRIVPRRAAAGRGSARPGEGDDLRFLRSRLAHIPVRAGRNSFLPGLELACDIHQQAGVIATDGLGRAIGDPLDMKPRSDAPRLASILQRGGIEEATTLGRVVYLRSGAGVAAFELASAGGAPGAPKNRPLWMAPDRLRAGGEPAGIGFVFPVAGGRLPRAGNVPLGARASEPRPTDAQAGRSCIAGQAQSTGLPLLAERTLRLHDPLTGRILWERQRLPAATELLGDESVLCVCPADGRGAVVLAMADGRIVRSIDLPPAERRLLSHGRRLVVIQPGNAAATRAGNAGVSSRVALELLDTADGGRMPLGDFPGESRAAAAGDGRLAVVEPSGDLSVVDLDSGGLVFRTRLPDMPAGPEYLQVLTWADRHLVLVGRAETAEEQRQLERVGVISQLPAMPGQEMPHLVTGSLWAVDRTSGDMLWPVPATILRHSLLAHSGSQLPVLLFARTIQSPREPDRQRLSVLCLDKRTGQAVYADDRLNSRGPRQDMMPVGCAISGDPANHTISITQGRRDMPDLDLEFTGGPAAPRPPFQAAAARPAATDPLGELELWIKKALALPLPF